MKVIFSVIAVLIVSFTATAQETDKLDKKILKNDLVQDLSSTLGEQCSIVEEEDSKIQWQCMGAVLEEDEKAFEAIKELKLKNSGSCGFSIVFACSDKTVTLSGKTYTTTLYNADNTTSGEKDRVIIFESIQTVNK